MTSKTNKIRNAREANRKFKKKANPLAIEKVVFIDYKDVSLLQRFMSDRSKIRGQRMSGTNVQQQRDLATAIKNAREMALLPYTKRVASVGRGPRGPRGPRGSEGAVDQVEEQNIDAVIENLETGIEFEAADEIETNEEG